MRLDRRPCTNANCMNSSELKLTPQENEEIKDKGRWLRRVVNPFADFHVILAIGAAGSQTTTEVARRREDRQVRDHAKDLYVPVVPTDTLDSPWPPRSTPAQRKVYCEDFEQIIENLPFIKNRLESNDSSLVIRKIAHKVRRLRPQSPRGKITYGTLRSNRLQTRPSSLTRKASSTTFSTSSRKSISRPVEVTMW